MERIDPRNTYYLENAIKWDSKSSFVDIVGRPLVLEIVNKLAKKGNEALLDIGSGTGRWTKLFAENIKKFVGIDSVSTMIEISNKRNSAPNIEYKQAEMSKIRSIFNQGEFDIITSLMVIQHAKNKKELMNLNKDIKYLLKPGGNYIFLIPHPFAIMINKSKWGIYCFDKDFSYFENFPFTGKVRLACGDYRNVGAYFHGLEEYLNSLTEVGLKIKKIYEPRPSEGLIKKYPDMETDAKIPVCMIVVSVKD